MDEERCIFFLGIVTLLSCPLMIPQLPAKDTHCDTNAWCETNSFDRAFTDAFGAPDAKTAALFSHMFCFGSTQMLAFGSVLLPVVTKWEWTKRIGYRYIIQDLFILIGAVCFTLGFTQLAKNGARRQRPCFYYGNGNETEYNDNKEEEYLSFFSGDTSVAFAACFAGLWIAKMRGRSYAFPTHPFALRYKSIISISPLAFIIVLSAFLGGFLRVVAYMHWTTDVMMGAFVGIFFGTIVIMLYTSKEEGNGNLLKK